MKPVGSIYLDVFTYTKTNDNKATFRASPLFRIEAPCAGNGRPLPSKGTKSRDSGGAPCGRAAGWPSAVLRRLDIEWLCLLRRALRLTTQPPAECGFVIVCLSKCVDYRNMLNFRSGKTKKPA